MKRTGAAEERKIPPLNIKPRSEKEIEEQEKAVLSSQRRIDEIREELASKRGALNKVQTELDGMEIEAENLRLQLARLKHATKAKTRERQGIISEVTALVDKLTQSEEEKSRFEAELDQMRAKLKIKYFSLSNMDVFSDSLFIYQDQDQTCRQIRDPKLELFEHKTVQIGNDLLAFQYLFPLKVTKYCNPSHSSLILKKELTAGNLDLEMFSLVSLNEESVYLSGGLDQAENRISPEVHIYNVGSNSWSQAPDLNEARSEHSSSTLGDSVYIFCGWDGSQYLNSIECLNTRLASGVWGIMRSFSALSKRGSPCVSAISDSEFIIMGGYAGADHLSDVYVFNTIACKVQLEQTLQGTQFACFGAGAKLQDGTAVALVADREVAPFMVRYTRSISELKAYSRFSI